MSGVLDSVCLFALVTDMAASLGAGILSLSGGIVSFFPDWSLVLIQPTVTLLILLTFLISASSGIEKGIRSLSLFNLGFFILLLVLFVILGQGFAIFPAFVDNLRTYSYYFLDLGLQISGAGNQWTYDWTTFNLAIWTAWAPITALFLGKIAVGRTVREFLIFNLFLPAVFCTLWMSVFGEATLGFAEKSPDFYKNLLEVSGPESIIYQVFKDMGFFKFFSQLFILAMFISFVTAADSSTDALASISMKKTGKDVFKTDVNLKVLWGTLMASLAWVMITFAGVDGVRMLSVIGGLPALFLIILATYSLVLLLINPKKHLP
jgi:choline-glycine betaine transporter